MPAKYKMSKSKPRGVSNRNAALDWIRKNARSGVVYFADDDKHDLKSMFEREKLSTAEDQNAMLSRLAWLLNFTIGAMKKVLT